MFEAIDVLDMQSDLDPNVDQAQQGPLEFDPGTEWKYGAGHRRVGPRWWRSSPASRWMSSSTERIFKPLGMTDTGLRAWPRSSRFRHQLLLRRQEFAEMANSSSATTPTSSGYLRKPGLSPAAAGWWYGADYLRFLLMIENDGKVGTASGF